MFKTLSFYTFFAPVKVIFSQFWTRVWRNIEKHTKIKQHQKIDRILFQTRYIDRIF